MIDVAKTLEADVFRAIDRLRNGAVDERLQRRLHRDMLRRCQRLGCYESLRQRRVGPERLAEFPMGEILDGLLFRRLIVAENAPPVDEIEHRLDAARDICRRAAKSCPSAQSTSGSRCGCRSPQSHRGRRRRAARYSAEPGRRWHRKAEMRPSRRQARRWRGRRHSG